MSEPTMRKQIALVLKDELARRYDIRVKADSFGTLLLADAVLAAIEAAGMVIVPREPENEALQAGYEAMFTSKWDGTQAPMMGAGWSAMIDAATAHDGGGK